MFLVNVIVHRTFARTVWQFKVRHSSLTLSTMRCHRAHSWQLARKADLSCGTDHEPASDGDKSTPSINSEIYHSLSRTCSVETHCHPFGRSVVVANAIFRQGCDGRVGSCFGSSFNIGTIIKCSKKLALAYKNSKHRFQLNAEESCSCSCSTVLHRSICTPASSRPWYLHQSETVVSLSNPPFFRATLRNDYQIMTRTCLRLRSDALVRRYLLKTCSSTNGCPFIAASASR
ncbi:unnamed protein product [Nesidiocoris tenuis]|uniref:Uncharacterized protein n=1 Tax=Nesidiocoris tenuis TaxID=355587 RepID=A0A6H5GU74_9HEMI|nr:unnamed protein product [Nesidiocoris tenuis]